MSYVLAGLLKGAGEGIAEVGKSINERREAALKAAQKEAEYERARADRKVEKAEEREYQGERDETNRAHQERMVGVRGEQALEVEGVRHTNRLEALGQSQEYALERLTKSQEFTDAQRRLGQDFRLNLLRETDRLAGARDERSIRLREEIKEVRPAAVSYGAPDENGMADVDLIMPNGEVRRARSKVKRDPKEVAEENKRKNGEK